MHPSDSSRLSLSKLFAACLLAAVLALLVCFNELAALLTEGQLTGSDDYVRLQQIRDWMAGAGWFDLRQTRLSDAGIDMHWSRVVDLPIAGLIRLGEQFFGIVGAERMAALVWPSLLLMATTGVLIAIQRRLQPGVPPLAVALLVGLNIFAVIQFAPGRFDHHNVQILLISLAILGGVTASERRGGMLAGVACALSIMVGLEALVLIAVIGGMLCLRWIVGEDANGVRFASFGGAFAVALAGAFLISVPPSRYSMAACDALSIAYLVLGLVAGLGAAAAGRFTNPSPARRSGIALLIAAGSVTALLLVAQRCVSGPMVDLSAEAQFRWLSKISEAQPLLTYLAGDPFAVVNFILYPLVAVLCWRALAKRGDPWRTAMLGAPIAAGAILSLVQIRAAHFNGVLAVPLFAAAIPIVRAWLADPAALRRPVARRVAAGMAGLLAVGGMTYILVGARSPAASAEESSPTLLRAGTCERSEALESLAHLPVGRVLNMLDLGGRALVETPHVILTGHYHRSEQAVLDGTALLDRPVSTVADIVRARRADYVLLCLSAEMLSVAQVVAPDGFLATFGTEGPPPWLIHHARADGLAVYRVSRERM